MEGVSTFDTHEEGVGICLGDTIIISDTISAQGRGKLKLVDNVGAEHKQLLLG